MGNKNMKEKKILDGRGKNRGEVKVQRRSRDININSESAINQRKRRDNKVQTMATMTGTTKGRLQGGDKEIEEREAARGVFHAWLTSPSME